MNILLVYPDVIQENANWPGYYYQGIGSISSYLKKKNHSVSLLHILKFDKEDIIKRIMKNSYDIIGFSATTNQFYYVSEIAKRLKENNVGSFLICGGAHPTLNPEESISEGVLDAICIGEGEEPTAELCDNISHGKDIHNIPNLWVRRNNEIHKNPLRPLANLDNLPFPDRDIFNYKSLLHERMKEASVMASRGCPYECSYCCNGALKNIYSKAGRYVRFKSVEYLIQELEDNLRKYDFIEAFAFDDDILPLNMQWFRNFVISYKKNVNLPFTCNIRPNLVDDASVGLLKYAGCWRIHIGIESGNSRVRNSILSRKITNENILKAINLAAKNGIKVYTYNMLGVPGEGCREILDTIKMNAVPAVNFHQVSFYYPYKHTPLGEFCEQNKLIKNANIGDFFKESPLKFSYSHSTKLEFYMKNFTKLIDIYRNLNKLPIPLSHLGICMSDLIFSSLLGIRLFSLINRIYGKIYFILKKTKLKFIGLIANENL